MFSNEVYEYWGQTGSGCKEYAKRPDGQVFKRVVFAGRDARGKWEPVLLEPPPEVLYRAGKPARLPKGRI